MLDSLIDFLQSIHLNSLMLIILWLAAVNFIAFITMGRDKRRARNGQWRTPEATLFLQAIIGGSVGSILGMLVFRHKTRKWKFRIGMPLILAVQVLLIVLLVMNASEIVFM